MAQLRGVARPYTDWEIQRILTCVVAWSGNVKVALRHLQEEGELEAVPYPTTVHEWIRGKHAELYIAIRDQNQEHMDRELADKYRGVAAQAVDATEVGVKAARKLLKSGKEKDPARAAANLATVATKTLRDYALLEGKPTSIRESRDLPEVMRTLLDMGVLVPQVQQQLESPAEPDDADVA